MFFLPYFNVQKAIYTSNAWKYSLYNLIWWMKICIKEYKILFSHIWKGPKIKEGQIELEKHSLLFEMGEK